MTDKVQKGGIKSTNIQTDEINIHQGLTYEEVRQVATDVFKSNFYDLADEAKAIAEARAEKITEDFLRKLEEENPIGFSKSQDPDFQYSLYTIQKEHARSGDDELASLLVDLLVDRSKEDTRNILQIVLNESLSVAPKLTKENLSALTISFIFRYTTNNKINNHVTLGEYLDDYCSMYIPSIPESYVSYQHLQFCSCASISMGSISLERILGETYQGLFMKGFDMSEIVDKNLQTNLNDKLFIPCLNNPEKLQINHISKDSFVKEMENLKISHEDRTKLLELFDLNKMDDSEIREKCIEIRPYMKDLIDKWTNTNLQNLELSSVGIAIGHANIKRIIGNFADLSIWIN